MSDEQQQQPAGDAPEEQAKPTASKNQIQILITMTRNGDVSVMGAINNVVIALGLLDMAKQIVIDKNKADNATGIQPVPFMPPGLLRP